MAVSRTYSHLTIDEWAAVLQISPWEINQFKYPGSKTAQCSDVIYQYGWQKDHLSREEISQAIANAEQMIADELMYWPAPHYVLGETVIYTRPYQRQLSGYAGTPRGEWKSASARWHNIISGGVLNRTQIGTITGGNLGKLDEDGDGVFETFTATITDPAIGTITDPNELALYFISVNRHGEVLDETWRIRPVKVTIAGNTATFRGHRTLLANPAPEYAVDATANDAKVDANYVTSVECWRTFTDTTATAALPYQGVAEWKTIPGCTNGCTFAINPLCINEQNYAQGEFYADFGNTCDWPFPNREADRLSISYVSGVPLVNGRMAKYYAEIVAYLSVSLLASEKCGCDRTNRILDKLRAPVLKFQDKSADATSYAESANAFPMTYGAQWAWARVNANRHIEAVSL